MASLLAVDLGLRTGLALYADDGRLRWYRSHNFGARPRLKRGIHALLAENADLQWLVLEGGAFADLWEHAAAKRAIPVLRVSAEQWRHMLLLDREQRSGVTAKQNADRLARQIIAWSHLTRPTSLRHDAAEAILVGYWGLAQVGWLPDSPPLRPR